MLTEFIAEGRFGRHIRRMRTLYQQRRDAVRDAAAAELRGGLDLRAAHAGLHAVGWLPETAVDLSLPLRAAALGVDVLPLSNLYHGTESRPCCCAWTSTWRT